MLSESCLLNFRDKINEIDKNIVDLLSKRKILVKKIAEFKIKNNQSIRDKKREENMLKRLINLGKKHHLPSKYITQLFQLIIKESVETQEMLLKNFYIFNKKRIFSFSFLGPKGSYSQIATTKYANQKLINHVEKECQTFKECISNVEKKISDYAILPLENSYSGPINEVFILLKKTHLFISGDIKLSVNHCLVGIKKIKLTHIKTVYSHPQPFKQCSKFIKNFPKWEIQYSKSTSDAMKKIIKYNQISNAALASEDGSKIYGLSILAKNITNQKKNFTKFILLSRDTLHSPQNKAYKTTLIFSIKKKLEIFNQFLIISKKYNLITKKLIFKDSHENTLEYNFYTNIQDHVSSLLIQNILQDIQKITTFIKILGCYPIENSLPIKI